MRRLTFVVAAAVALLLAAPLAAFAATLSGPSLKRMLARLDARMGHASGGYVRDLTASKTLFHRNFDKRLMPASNEKLYTTATALNRVRRRRRADDRRRGGARRQMSASTASSTATSTSSAAATRRSTTPRCKKLASQVRFGGHVTKIDGTIFADDSLFDQRRGSYESNYAPDSEVEGSLGALVWGHGVSDADGPAHAAAARLKHFLSAAGVGVAKAPVKVGKVPTGLAQQLATLDSPPISTLIRDTNRPSDNFYAEMLLKDLGASYGSGGTTPAGAAVVRSANAALGIRDAVVDGSGLSRANRTSAHQVVRLLTSMSQSSDFDAFRTSLPAPGEGTLVRRMRGTAAKLCRAKTGTLTGVSALSGYCPARNGNLIAFSFIENGVCTSCAKALEDRMVPLIASYAGTKATIPVRDDPDDANDTDRSPRRPPSPPRRRSRPRRRPSPRRRPRRSRSRRAVA